MARSSLSLAVSPHRYAIARLEPSAEVPSWAEAPPFSAVVRTSDELSVLCRDEAVPAAARAERGFRLLALAGPFAFDETGILSSVLGPLAEARIGILALSTFDTDYVLVKEGALEAAVAVLRRAGHAVTG